MRIEIVLEDEGPGVVDVTYHASGEDRETSTAILIGEEIKKLVFARNGQPEKMPVLEKIFYGAGAVWAVFASVYLAAGIWKAFQEVF